MEKLISPHKAAMILGVTPNSIRSWCIQGKIRAIRTPGNHRRYYLKDIMAIAPPEPAMIKAQPLVARDSLNKNVQPQPEQPHRGIIRKVFHKIWD